jgi:hypothetical protein
MTAGVQALPGNFEMSLRRCGDVDYVRPGFTKQVGDIAKASPDRESVSQLARHQRLAIARSCDLTAFDPLDLLSVSVGDFAAAYDPNLKHGCSRSGKLQNSASSLRQ